MFNHPKAQSPFRVERIRLKLHGFDFHVEYITGQKNPSDFISRCSKFSVSDVDMGKDLEAHVHLVTRTDISAAITNKDIRNEISVDKECILIKKSILSRNLAASLVSSYKQVFNQLSFADGLILRGERLFIPRRFRQHLLTTANEGHQGIVKTKALVMSRLWFTNIDKDVETFVRSCMACQASVVHHFWRTHDSF